jgi:hypothetical protein
MNNERKPRNGRLGTLIGLVGIAFAVALAVIVQCAAWQRLFPPVYSLLLSASSGAVRKTSGARSQRRRRACIPR